MRTLPPPRTRTMLLPPGVHCVACTSASVPPAVSGSCLQLDVIALRQVPTGPPVGTRSRQRISSLAPPCSRGDPASAECAVLAGGRHRRAHHKERRAAGSAEMPHITTKEGSAHSGCALAWPGTLVVQAWPPSATQVNSSAAEGEQNLQYRFAARVGMPQSGTAGCGRGRWQKSLSGAACVALVCMHACARLRCFPTASSALRSPR